MAEKNMKRFLVLGILGLFMISMMAGVVAPYDEDGEWYDENDFIRDTDAEKVGTALGAEARGFGEGVAAFFKGLFGDAELGKGQWLTVLFFAIILGMFVYTALSSFIGTGKEFIVWGITIAVTLVAILAIPENYLVALKTSYGAMGLTILTVIPFIIILAFTLKTNNMAIARGTWLVFVVYYIWMYIAEIIAVSTKPDVSSIPYWVAIVAGVIMFFSIGIFRKWLFGATLESEIELATAKNRKRTAGLNAESERLEATGISQG